LGTLQRRGCRRPRDGLRSASAGGGARIGRLRHAAALAAGTTIPEARDPARSMAEQAHPQRTQRNGASAAAARLQRPYPAWRARPPQPGNAGPPARNGITQTRRKGRGKLFPTLLRLARVSRPAPTGNLPAGKLDPAQRELTPKVIRNQKLHKARS